MRVRKEKAWKRARGTFLLRRPTLTRCDKLYRPNIRRARHRNARMPKDTFEGVVLSSLLFF